MLLAGTPATIRRTSGKPSVTKLRELLKDLEHEQEKLQKELCKPADDLSGQNFKAGQYSVYELWSERIADALSTDDDE